MALSAPPALLPAVAAVPAAPAAPAAHRAGGVDEADVLILVNTGTPTAPRSGPVRRFLGRFLSDRRVVELPRVLWLPLLYGLILPLRGPRSAHRYRLIWQSQGSPLLRYNSELRAELERQLAAQRPGVRVEQAFLYSAPLLGERLASLRDCGVQRLTILPLYPQGSGTTTGAVFDQVARALSSWRTLPQLRQIADYCTHPQYVGALADSVREHWQQQGRTEHLLMSFHGIPQSYARRGDRYPEQCRETAERLASALALQPADWSLSFQSRFGAARWLLPATVEVLRDLPRQGVRAVTVVCPGFPVDCLETLEEIALGGRDVFLKAGGERFDYVPALNARPQHARALAAVVADRAAGPP